MIPAQLLAIDPFAPASVPMLLFLLKATCLLLAAFGATLVMQRASAGARHLIWLVVLGALLVLPVLATWSPLRLAILPRAFALSSSSPESRQDKQSTAGSVIDAAGTSSQARDVPSGSDRGISAAVPIVKGDGHGAVSSVPMDQPLPLGLLLLIVWAAVALVLAGWLSYGAMAVHRIVRRSRPLDSPAWQTPLYEIADRLELADAPRLLRSEDVKMPFACGLVRATIVLPAESDGWSADRRSAVLLHELGHVRRRDLVGHTLGRFACALYWFHPLVWTAARKLRSESERACDDLALTCGARPSEYAEHLLDIVTCVRDHATPSVALAMAHRKEFEGRMLAILNPELRRKGPSRMQSLSLAGALASLFLVVSAAAPVARAADKNPDPSSNLPAPVAGASNSAQFVDSQLTTSISTGTRQRTATSRVEGNAPAQHGTQPLPDESQTSDSAPPRSIDSAVARAREFVLGVIAPQGDSASAQQKRSDERPALLANVLRTDSSAELRRIAAWGLHEYGDSDVAVDALAAALRRDTNASVREMAAWALGGADDEPKASEALVAALRDADAKVRATAIWALGNAGNDEAVPAIADMLGHSNAEIRTVAAWAIGNIGPRRAPRGLTTALVDRDPQVREAVAWALYQIRDADAVPALDAALGKETERDVQRAFIRALAATGENSVDAIKRLLDSKDPEVRTTAIRALAGGGASSPWPWPWPNPRPFP